MVLLFFLQKWLHIQKSFVFLQQKSIGEQSSLDVHNLVMTSSERANLSVSFFYAFIAVIQYCIFSPDFLTPTVIFTTPIPTKSYCITWIWTKLF